MDPFTFRAICNHPLPVPFLLQRKDLAEAGVKSCYLPEVCNLELAYSQWLVLSEWEKSPLNDLLTHKTSSENISFSLEKFSMSHR